jgi:hypothetical protein
MKWRMKIYNVTIAKNLPNWNAELQPLSTTNGTRLINKLHTLPNTSTDTDIRINVQKKTRLLT